jgi:Na+-driven multidrug efflux pump
VRFVVIWQLAIGLIWLVASDLVAALFIGDKQVQAILSGYLIRVPLSYSGLGVCMLMVSVCNALGLGLRALLISTLRLFVCFLPLLWLGSQINGIYGLMSGALTGNLLAGVMAYGFYRAGMRQLQAKLTSTKA